MLQAMCQIEMTGVFNCRGANKGDRRGKKMEEPIDLLKKG
jgi:hypothetical protein